MYHCKYIMFSKETGLLQQYFAITDCFCYIVIKHQWPFLYRRIVYRVYLDKRNHKKNELQKRSLCQTSRKRKIIHRKEKANTKLAF